MPPAPVKSHLLVVDDDPTATLISKLQLTRAGYRVTTAMSVAEGRSALVTEGLGSYEAVVTDYRMPGEDGLAMLRHVRESDATLSVILLTAEGEKNLVAASLRDGAHNFLDKPVTVAALTAAVADAVESTRRRRKLRTDAASATALGELQTNLLGREIATLRDRLSVRFNPHQSAGGDFTAGFDLGGGRFVLLVSDVSGHDLRAALHSAYLQGMARGLFERGAPLDEVFAHLNRRLLHDWNNAGKIQLSLAAFGISVDLAARTITWLNCGLPAPCLAGPEGWPVQDLPPAESPLGWFDTLAASTSASNPGGSLHLWSDGLQDLAERRAVSPLALAFRLHRTNDSCAEIVRDASDDILSVRLDLGDAPTGDVTLQPQPLLNETFAGTDLERIDAILVYCGDSLRLALPELTAENLIETVLCIRESLINALKHGCEMRPDRFARLHAVWHPLARQLSIRVADDGPGHRFDVAAQERRTHTEMVDAHTGLLFIKNLATSMKFSPSANCVTMDFSI